MRSASAKADHRAVGRYCCVLLAGAVLLCSQSALALHAVALSPYTPEEEGLHVEVRAQIGVLSGEAHELVFAGVSEPGNENHKNSELTWDLESVMMAGVIVSLGDGPLTLSLGAWTAITEGSGGQVVDYDWLGDGSAEWSDRSIGDADLVSGMRLDANLAIRLFDAGRSSVSIVAGVMLDKWEWEAFGGEYVYSETGWRDSVGVFADDEGVTYEQSMVVPYLGIEGVVDTGVFAIHGYILYSGVASAEDKDFRILRDLHFEASYDSGAYLAMGVSVTVDLGDATFVQVAVDHQELGELRGDREVLETGDEVEDASGMSHESIMISAAIGVRL